MASEALGKFGQWPMKRVRDEAISDWEMIVDGRMKDEDSRRIHAEVCALGDDVRAFLLARLPGIVNTVLHHLHWSLEQTEEIRVGVEVGDEYVES